MIKEAKRFAFELKALHRDLTALSAATDTGLNTVKTVLNSNLPRAYDEGVLGVAPVDKEERIVGINVNLEGVAAAQAELKARLQSEVLHPLEQWLAAYRSIKVRNKKCEEVRLELDNKRRSALALHEKHNRLRDRKDKHADAAFHKAQNEEDKMNRLAQRYAEVEAEVFNALLTLIRDTTVLREYAAAAIAILQRCFTLSYQCFDLNTPVPLPLLPAPATPPAGGYITYATSPSDVGRATGSTGGYPSPAGTTRSATMYAATGTTVAALPAPPAITASPSYNQAVPPRAPPSPNADGPTASMRRTEEGTSTPTVVVPVAVAITPPPTVGQSTPALASVPVAAAPAAVGENGPASASLPAPPAWFLEAKRSAKPGQVHDSDDDDDDNPFNKGGKNGRKGDRASGGMPVHNPFKPAAAPATNDSD